MGETSPFELSSKKNMFASSGIPDSISFGLSANSRRFADDVICFWMCFLPIRLGLKKVVFVTNLKKEVESHFGNILLPSLKRTASLPLINQGSEHLKMIHFLLGPKAYFQVRFSSTKKSNHYGSSTYPPPRYHPPKITAL